MKDLPDGEFNSSTMEEIKEAIINEEIENDIK